MQLCALFASDTSAMYIFILCKYQINILCIGLSTVVIIGQHQSVQVILFLDRLRNFLHKFT